MPIKDLPQEMKWLDRKLAPKVWVEARRHFGVLEHRGTDNNPSIMAWAKELGVGKSYSGDVVPWCGLFMGIVLKRAGYQPPEGWRVLGARFFLDFGTKIPLEAAMFGDVLVFARPGGNHVGLYIGEATRATDQKKFFNVYGGNQSDAVGFAWLAKSRCIGVRRCPWRIGQPSDVVKHYLNMDGTPSENEA